MRKHIAVAIRLTLVSTLILGLFYPLFVTAITQVAFPQQANGSLIIKDGQIIGSDLIAQSFRGPEYFHPRPSTASNPNLSQGENLPENAWLSGGSNLGPTSKTLATRVKIDVEKLIKENPGLKAGEIPTDMVSTSASGLDPDISPANAKAQAGRIAKARGISKVEVRRLIDQNTVRRQFGIIGEPRVNVLKLNLALDKIQNPR